MTPDDLHLMPHWSECVRVKIVTGYCAAFESKLFESHRSKQGLCPCLAAKVSTGQQHGLAWIKLMPAQASIWCASYISRLVGKSLFYPTNEIRWKGLPEIIASLGAYRELGWRNLCSNCSEDFKRSSWTREYVKETAKHCFEFLCVSNTNTQWSVDIIQNDFYQQLPCP